ncbi:hypothetical protein D3C72_1917230 [compost metagenome]
MKYASIDFHVNYFSEHDVEPLFYIFGFTVDDPTGSVAAAMEDEDTYVGFGEDLEEHLDGACVDSGFDADEQFFGGSVYELSEAQLDLIRSGAQKLRNWFTELGGVVGPLIEVSGNYDTAEAELKKRLKS